ncbi:MAG TPA: type III polyketide synthase [Planctomycetaceae bacterium]|nr:type III polyketide synthase [Planctomycetaceae bacterium]
MTQQQALEMSTDLICRDERESRLLRAMYRKSKVEQRRTCVLYTIAYEWIDREAPPSSSAGPTTQERMELYAQHARPLAMEAAQRALADAGTEPSEITHLVTISCTGFDAPGVDIHLFDQLGLTPDVQRLNIGFMGCHGAINGLRAAQGLAAADPAAKILLVAVELCSLHFKFQWDPKRMMGNALFADGAAAIVLEGDPTDQKICSLADTASYLIDDSREAITWEVGDFGFDMSLDSAVPQLISQHLRTWLEKWLTDRGHNLDAIQSWVVHPGGPKILDAVEEALGLDKDDLSTSRSVLAEHGNMSSPTILFVLKQFLEQQSKGPYLALGFGPGLMAEMALFE